MNKGKLYRNPSGKFMGVCLGLADWLHMDVGLVRLGFIIAAFMTGGVVVVLYIALGVFLPISGEKNSMFDDIRNEYGGKNRGGKNKPKVTVDDVKKEFDNLKSRVGKMEDTVFNKERDWDQRFNKNP